MGLEKSGGPAKKAISKVVESAVESNKIRSDLIDIYRGRLKDVTLSDLAPNDLLLSFNDVSALAYHLAESGNELEANHLRKEAIHVLKERAEQFEIVAFSAAKSLNDESADAPGSRASLNAEYKDLHNKIASISRELEQKKVDLAKLPKESEEHATLELEIADVERDTNENMLPRYNELNQILTNLRMQDKLNADLASSSASQAISMKQAAAELLIDMGSYNSAFELLLDSVDKYFNSKIAGAEKLMHWLVETTVSLVQTTRDGAFNPHNLLELAFEGCLDTAMHIDNAVFNGKAKGEYLNSALWFRSKAAAISRDLGYSHEATLEPLLKAAKDYGEHGFTDIQANLLEFALKMDLQMSARPVEEKGIGQYL